MSCPWCGGSMIGDGYTSVIHCEFANTDDYWDCEPDAGPVWCSWEEVDATID